jgi:Tol biopolymer transport system component
VRSLPTCVATTVVAALVVALALSPAATPTPPGRNGLIAFVTLTPDAQGRLAGDGLAVIRPDGTGLRRLTRDGRDHWPAWSPDGRWVAFVRDWQIYLVRANGTGLRRLTPAGRYGQPAWSPGGDYIAVVRGVNQSALSVMRADGTGQRWLYRTDLWVDGPSWSPDGAQIAFGLSGDGHGGDGSIVVIKRGGGRLRYVTDARIEKEADAQPGGWAQDEGPDWSPDGKRILFTRVVYFCFPGSCDQPEVFSVSVDGSDLRSLTPLDLSLPTSENAMWSPDGSWIVADTYLADGRPAMSIFSLTGELVRVLSPRGFSPAWQPLKP